jgi:tRNA(Leu) C34 or U34 (ribose-2'-O)-methylase TrmL
MDRCAETIGEKKFSRLPVRRQHALLAELAEAALETAEYRSFLERYELMHSWSALDRYTPPEWLSPAESLQEFCFFHAGFARKPEEIELSRTDSGPIAWQALFDVTIVMDQVRSPYNVGSILRLVDNAGFAGLVHATQGLDLSHARLRRAARGAERWIPVRFVADLPAFLQQADVPVVALENCSGAVEINQWQPPKKFFLVVGNESYGIAAAVRECCEECVQIPIHGYKRSMNVHQALAIAAHRIAGFGEKVRTDLNERK